MTLLTLPPFEVPAQTKRVCKAGSALRRLLLGATKSLGSLASYHVAVPRSASELQSCRLGCVCGRGLRRRPRDRTRVFLCAWTLEGCCLLGASNESNTCNAMMMRGWRHKRPSHHQPGLKQRAQLRCQD